MPTYRYSFLSHAHVDNALCDPYAAGLTRLGAPHYYDREAPQHGALLPYLLQEELRKARVLVVLVTPAAQASEWVKLEIAMFHHLMASEPDRTLVWVRLVDCVVEPLLAAHLGIDAVGRPVEQVLAELARALEDRSAAAPTSPAGHPTVAATSGSGGFSRIVDWRNGMGDHTTIVDALAAARPGERILVRKGVYEGGLVIDKPLEVVGDGQPGDVEVRASGANVLVFTATQGRVANLTLRQTGGVGSWFGVDITSGYLELEDCDITSQSYACVIIHGGADPRLRRCRMHDSKKGDGVFVYDQGQGLLEDCEITGNTSSGIEVVTGGAPTLRRCRIHDNKYVGVLVQVQGQGVFEDCEITGNGYSGIRVGAGGAPTVRKCRINRNAYHGIWVYEDGGGVYEDNDLWDNTNGAWRITVDSAAMVTRRGNRER
jgi:F-box protein 11